MTARTPPEAIVDVRVVLRGANGATGDMLRRHLTALLADAVEYDPKLLAYEIHESYAELAVSSARLHEENQRLRNERLIVDDLTADGLPKADAERLVAVEAGTRATQIEAAPSRKRSPESFGDPLGPAYQRGEIQQVDHDELFVEMTCCGFRYSADHEDSTTEGYTCPLCAPDEERAKLIAKLNTLAAALRFVEFNCPDYNAPDPDANRFCPGCGNGRTRGHMDGCLLRAALGAAPSEETPT